MGNLLKHRRPPAELASSGQVFDLKEELSSFERLVEIVEEDFRTLSPGDAPPNWRQSPVAIKLRFEWADVRRQYAAVEGSIATTIPAVCQRCMEPFGLTLKMPLKLMFAGSDSTTVAGEQYDVWELDEEVVSPLDIVEEALIIAMPLAALHGSGTECGAVDDHEGPGSAETVRPFADLKSLLRDGDEY